MMASLYQRGSRALPDAGMYDLSAGQLACHVLTISTMRFPRSSGIVLHPTSLPGPFGVGDLGPEARRFADYLADAGQTLWQVLPLGPTGYGDSPYQCFSALAGNPLLISLDELAKEPWFHSPELLKPPEF